jgi:hypothetical protein
MRCSKLTLTANLRKVKILCVQVCGLIEGCHEFLKEYKGNGL